MKLSVSKATYSTFHLMDYFTKEIFAVFIGERKNHKIVLNNGTCLYTFMKVGKYIFSYVIHNSCKVLTDAG